MLQHFITRKHTFKFTIITDFYRMSALKLLNITQNPNNKDKYERNEHFAKQY